MSRGRIVFKVIMHIVFLLVVYILQALVFPYIPMQGFMPLLLPVAVVAIAMFEGGVWGGVFGLFAGMLCDNACNMPTIAFTLLLTGAGLAVGFAAQTVLARGFPSCAAAAGAVLIISSAVQLFWCVFFEGASVIPLLFGLIVQVIVSLIFTLPIYFIARALGRGVTPV